jgi:hypothetical protein
MTADHEPRRLDGASQSWCTKTRVWLLLDDRDRVIASSTEGWPGLPVASAGTELSRILKTRSS